MTDDPKEKPIYFYVANLGSEVQRIFVWKEKRDRLAMQNAYERALEIIDKIKSFGNQSANKEMDLLQDFLNNMISGKTEFVDRSQISTYFNPFALRVMK